MTKPVTTRYTRQCNSRHQDGAVLFVGLIFLLLLTLLGVTGMQVTVLQERMAGNFRVAHQAFEQTEGQIAGGQADVSNVLSALDTYTQTAISTSTHPTPWESWLTDISTTPQLQILRRYCGAGCDGVNAPFGSDPERQVNFYVLTGQDFDPGTIATAIVQSVYVF